MTEFIRRIVENAISGTFGEHGYEITDIQVTPGQVDENPSIAFTLQTPFGTERVYEEIFDGYLVHDEGCWVDRLTELELDEEDRDELLSAVNSSLQPVVAHTKLRLEEVEASAKSAGAFIQFEDNELNDTWRLYRMKGNGLIGSANSLHTVLGELRRYRQSIRSGA